MSFDCFTYKIIAGGQIMNKKEDLAKANINWYPGHMAKTKRLIQEMGNLIDVVYELVDARIPFSSKMRDIDYLVKNKPRVLVMAKKDLCDLNETSKWQKYYEKMGYKVLLADLNNNEDYKKLINLTAQITEEIQAKRAARKMQVKEIKALVIGIPNVGKSTLINKMAGKKVTKVGNMPGVTKDLSWLKTKYNILLLDSPGILWPKFESNEIALNLASMTAIRNEILPLDEVAVHVINKLIKYYPVLIEKRYNINLTADIEMIYESIGRKIGAIISGGEIDYDRVSATILNDIKNENLKNITFDRFDELIKE